MNSRHPARTMLVLLTSVLLSGAAAFIPAAHAETHFKVLYRFTGGSDGSDPESALIQDRAGNLYGTTAEGGGTGCGGSGCGTIFKLAPDGTETILYAFRKHRQNRGSLPYAGLMKGGDGRLYGTASAGGGTSCNGNGCGTVFRLRK